MKCIYVAIGQKGSTVAQTVATLEEHGAMEYTVVVNAPAGRRSGVQVPRARTPAAPSASTGWTTASTRSSSTTTSRSRPRRTASSRCCCAARRAVRRTPATSSTCTAACSSAPPSSSDALGAGSLTALPIIETKAGDVSAYIPTNVISITDGQIYLQDDLFKSGVRPAVDVGISVSRVGGAAQIKAMRAVAGTLKLDLAQFRDLEAFATFGSELDAVSTAQLERGYRLVELLKQPLNSPMPVEEQVVSIYVRHRGRARRPRRSTGEAVRAELHECVPDPPRRPARRDPRHRRAARRATRSPSADRPTFKAPLRGRTASATSRRGRRPLRPTPRPWRAAPAETLETE